MTPDVILLNRNCAHIMSIRKICHVCWRPLLLDRYMHLPDRTLLGPAPSPSPGSPVFIYQPALPYPFNACEPYIDTETQMLHWTKHTATYFADLNAAIAPFPELQERFQCSSQIRLVTRLLAVLTMSERGVVDIFSIIGQDVKCK